jgi:hypothetical protein
MPNECEKLIQFDTVSMTSNLATMYSATRLVNQDNYEELKTKYAADVPGYFDGSYDDFKLKRSHLSELFMSAGFTGLQQAYMNHSLSATGAALYSQCLAQQGFKPISAWISSKTGKQLAVTVKASPAGGVTFDVIGATPVLSDVQRDEVKKNKGHKLSAGGSTILLFDSLPKNDFLAIFLAKVDKSNFTDATEVSLPALRRFEIRKEQKELTAVLMCGAGGKGNTAGNQIARDAVFVAADGYYLKPDTVQVVNENVVGGPGVKAYTIRWVNGAAQGPVTRLVGHPYDVDGNNGDTQGIIEVTCKVVAEREYLVEVVE